MTGSHSGQRTDGTVPLAIIARVLLLSRRRVQQLVAEGHIPKTDGRYALVPCIQGYVRYLASRGPSDGAQRRSGDERGRLVKARADIAEHEAERIRSGLVAVADAKDALGQLEALLRGRCREIATVAAPLVAAETEPDRCHEIIAGTVHDALKDLAATVVEARR